MAASRDVGRGLVEARVDHFAAGITEGTSHDLCAAIVPVEPWLGDEDPDWHRMGI